MGGRTDAGLPGPYPPYAGDLGSDLRRGQDTADTGFRPLAEFDLQCADRMPFDEFHEALETEPAIGGTTAEVTRADLEDQVTAVQMVFGHSSFAGVVQTSGGGGPLVEGDDRRCAQRAEAHARHVHDRRRPERARPAARRAEYLAAFQPVVVGCRCRQRENRWFDDEIVRRLFQVVVRAEAEAGVHLLCRRVHPAALVAAERPLLVIAGHDVLAQLRADVLQQEAQVPDDREGSQDRVLALYQVVERHRAHRQDDSQRCPSDHRHAPY